MPYFLILFIAIPIIEIALLLRVGEIVGWAPTLLIVITTAIIGSAMLRQQGLATINTARQRLNAGEMPAQQLLEGMLIMIGGVLLLTPGFVTDTFGFVCLVPPTRQWLAGKVSARAVVGFSGAAAPGAAQNPHQRADAGRENVGQSGRGNAAGDIIDGDFKRLDDD